MLPKISIITPSFNQAQYIEQTICSVLDQGYPDLEYFVMDGGSTDGTVEILKKYEKHLAGWVSEKDRGQAHAINKGLARASGDVLAYINSDDWYLPGAFAAVGEHFAAHAGPSLLHGRCVLTDMRGARQDTQFSRIQSAADALDLWDYWWQRGNFVQPEVFWSRQMAQKTGPFNESLYYTLDYDYWLRALSAGAQVNALDQEFCCFRLHDQQKTHQAAKANAELWDLVEKALWSSATPLAPADRRRLREKWLCDGPVREFLELSDACVARGDGRLRRWWRLASFVAKHPRILQVKAMRERVLPFGV